MEAAAVCQWNALQPIEVAVRKAVDMLPSMSSASLTSLFIELRERNGLVSFEQLVTAPIIPESSDLFGQSHRIEWIAMPTSGRATCVERAVASYASNLAAFDRQCSVFIADDCGDQATGTEFRNTSVSLVRDRTQLPVVYAGREQKQAFAVLLSDGGRIPPAVIDYLLGGTGYSTRHPGANRNAILLQTLGCMVLSVDDDTVCDVGRVPETSSGGDVFVAGHERPEETWCVPEQKDALAFVTPTALDVLGEHESFLGKPLSSIVRATVSAGRHVNLDGMCGHFLTSLLGGSGRISITSNGAAGDSGFHTDLGLISHHSSNTRSRIQNLSGGYADVVKSRKIVRQSLRATVTHSDALSVGMFLGLDNRGLDARTLLPPFMPDFNNEDGVFARTVAVCGGDSYAAHLPFTLVHAPPTDRNYADDQGVRFRMSDVMLWCTSAWRSVPQGGSLHPVSSLGAWFQELALLPITELAEVLTVFACSHRSAQIETLENMLAEDGYMPVHWAEDIGGRIEAMRHASEYDFSMPSDLLLNGTDEAMPAIQAVLAAYGRLLEWWPAITQRAAVLAGDGIRLGRRI